jgi:ribA/ribD-fused uncharacterized protein
MQTNKSIYFYGKGQFIFLSNFYPCKIYDDELDLTFNCSEQYFVYRKCLTFDQDNKDLKERILSESDPSKIKKYGRMVNNFDNKVWEKERWLRMYTGIYLKFKQNEELKKKLLETGDRNLYEASPTDRIWGIGYGAKEAHKSPKDKYGQNLLGKILMKVRQELKDDAKDSEDAIDDD